MNNIFVSFGLHRKISPIKAKRIDSEKAIRRLTFIQIFIQDFEPKNSKK